METAVPVSAALSESTGLDTILLSDHTQIFSKNALGTVLKLGLFHLSPVEAPLSNVPVFFWGTADTGLVTSQGSQQCLMSEVFRELRKATAEQSFED